MHSCVKFGGFASQLNEVWRLTEASCQKLAAYAEEQEDTCRRPEAEACSIGICKWSGGIDSQKRISLQLSKYRLSQLPPPLNKQKQRLIETVSQHMSTGDR